MRLSSSRSRSTISECSTITRAPARPAHLDRDVAAQRSGRSRRSSGPRGRSSSPGPENGASSRTGRHSWATSRPVSNGSTSTPCGRRRAFEPGVVDLAEIDARPQDRQSAAPPGGVRRSSTASPEAISASAADLVAPAIEDGLRRPHDLRAVPAVGQPDLDPVGARPQQLRRLG